MKKILSGWYLVETAQKQGYKNKETNVSSITNILTKEIKKGISFEIYVSIIGCHEFVFYIEGFGNITVFNDIVDYENLSIIEKKLLKIYENEIKNL